MIIVILTAIHIVLKVSDGIKEYRLIFDDYYKLQWNVDKNDTVLYESRRTWQILCRREKYEYIDSTRPNVLYSDKPNKKRNRDKNLTWFCFRIKFNRPYRLPSYRYRGFQHSPTTLYRCNIITRAGSCTKNRLGLVPTKKMMVIIRKY